MDASGNLSLLAVSLPFRAAVSFRMGQNSRQMALWAFRSSEGWQSFDTLTGFERLVKIFHVGEGYAIPFYSLYRNYKCYEIYTEEGTLPWDNDLCYEVKPFRLRSAFGYIVIVLFAGIFTFLIHTWTILPNGNTLTVAEFAENYNHLLEYAELDTLPSLTKDGKWKEGEDDLSFLFFFRMPSALSLSFKRKTENYLPFPIPSRIPREISFPLWSKIPCSPWHSCVRRLIFSIRI